MLHVTCGFTRFTDLPDFRCARYTYPHHSRCYILRCPVTLFHIIGRGFTGRLFAGATIHTTFPLRFVPLRLYRLRSFITFLTLRYTSAATHAHCASFPDLPATVYVAVCCGFTTCVYHTPTIHLRYVYVYRLRLPHTLLVPAPLYRSPFTVYAHATHLLRYLRLFSLPACARSALPFFLIVYHTYHTYTTVYYAALPVRFDLAARLVWLAAFCVGLYRRFACTDIAPAFSLLYASSHTPAARFTYVRS